MPLESYDVLLNHARENKYAVGAFNIFALEFLPGVLEVAEEESSPVLLQINPIHFYLLDLQNYLIYLKAVINKVKVPVGINLDHGKTEEIILEGIQAGFPSVMYDGSRLPYAKNLENTKKIVSICRPQGITVEAELGTLNDEGLEINDENRDKLFTDPEKASEFVSATGINALAVSIGNAHGIYRGKPELDFDRLEKISEKVPVPLVLHGGSGLSDDDIQKAISLGINKINIYTEMSLASLNASQKYTIAGKGDYPTMLYQARQAVKEVVRHKMKVFGSSGKAL